MRALPFAYEIHPLSYTLLAQRRSVFMCDVTRYKNFSHHRAALTHTLTSIPVWLSYLADDVTARAVSPPDLAPPNLTSDATADAISCAYVVLSQFETSDINCSTFRLVSPTTAQASAILTSGTSLIPAYATPPRR